MAAVVAVMCIAGRSAFAADWIMPVGSSVSLPYGAAWVDVGGRRCTHGGVDIPATEGDIVRACVGGRVLFSGEVPSAAGGRVRAVTIGTPDGLSVSFMPFAGANVASGCEIAAGTEIGTLAASGDGSSPDSHLHLSVRRGETLLDPERFLGGAPANRPPEIPIPAAGAAAGIGDVRGSSAVPLSGGTAAALRTAGLASAPGVEAADAGLAPAAVAPRTITVAPPRMDGRAIHTLPDRAFRLPRVAIRLPDAAALTFRTIMTRLVLALAATAAMWACAARARVMPARSEAEGRR
jgi:hypothetical protein